MRATTTKRLGLESLEDRMALSCTVSVVDGNLIIKGDNAPDTVRIADNGAGQVSGFATGFGSFSYSNITRITVTTEGGYDVVTYNLMGDLKAGQRQYLLVGLGSNYDQTADRFRAMLYGNDLNANARLDIIADGGGGNDTMEVNALGTDVAGGATLKTTLLGGWGNDCIIQRYSGENDGAVAFRSRGGLGNDMIFQSMLSTAGSTGQLVGWVRGEEGCDNLTLNMFTPAANPPAFALLDGGANVDVWSATANVTVINCP